MKKIFFCVLYLVVSVVAVKGNIFVQAFDKEDYYAVMRSNSLEKINEMLTELKVSSFSEKEAYEGALLMKKAGLVGPPLVKLNLFKSGRKKLEAMIQKNNSNVEYRFLRVMIQENAPKILNYKNELADDCAVVKKSYKKLSPLLQQIILDYSQTSKKLNLKD